MASLFGVRCLLNTKKCPHFQFFAFSPRLASDTAKLFAHCTHPSGFNCRFSDMPYKYIFSNSFIPLRGIKLSTVGLCENDVEKLDSSENKLIDESKVRTKIIPPEVSIRYMKSKAYRTTYGDEAVWVKYRRNFKGQFPPPKTRARCIKLDGTLKTGNPCPICRDEYLVVHHSNLELLKQFISPHTGEVYPAVKTNVCRQKHFELEIAIEQAKDLGLLTFEVPFRAYNYEEYYPQLRRQSNA